ncbi:putative photosynthetic complex assembly protein PuhE [Yoonia vestfoldensis]|uniref:putative photosynthetic complex assembly protein PuhE n=1 Tax=Yoonia vestfoldensis TaxID=245188 RepID=UPI00036C1023|nr:putative photosynthetic complex assembly protein PuhE [Yoonia vestfoldensis]
MTGAVIAIIAAIFLWWFSTGIILLAVRKADRSGFHLETVLAGLPLLIVGVWAVAMSLTRTDVAGVYMGFLGALAIWGWIELAFLAGIVTGPVRDACLPGLSGKPRFFRAFGTVAHHELLLTVGLLGLVLASGGADNRMAVATYLILYLARIFAKLNLFFGVPRINMEFVPQRLAHLKSYFRRGPVTLAFPVAITALTALLAVCTERLWFAGSDATIVGYGLLTALAALALLEHWLMVIPLPDAKLWRWMLPAPKTMPKEER